MYQREQMGMTPDVERAGMQHPGMARQTIPQQPKALPYLPEAIAPDMVVNSRGMAAMSPAQLEAHLRASRQSQAAAQHPGAARAAPARQPLALPYLPEQPSPIVVDSAGRASTNPAQLTNYLRDMGFENVKAKGTPKNGLFDPIEEPTRASSSRAPAEKSSTRIKLELQRLQVQMRSVPAGADALYAQGLKRRWSELQAELNKQLSREASGAATSQRPTK
jgi:hypothetical protein